MAIKNIKERLEGSYRLIRIKRIKLGFFIIQLVLATILGLLVSYFMRMSWDPLYFPVDTFSFIFLIFVLIITGEAIYFKGMEIKYTRNKSRRFLLARNSIRRSAAIIAVSGLLVILLLAPYTQEKILETHAPGGNDIPLDAVMSSRQTFMSQDRFGMVRTVSITFTSSSPCNLTILKETAPIWNSNDVGTFFQWPDLGNHAVPVDEIVLYVENESPTPVTFTYELETEISPIITLYLPAMGIVFIIIQLVSISIMYPIRETYASSSIYSKKYVAKTESGEYTFSAKKLTKKDEEEQELLDSILDLETPPPAPPAPAPKAKQKKAVPPPPPVEVEMARVKGKVDEDLIVEEDVECANCGELNSAHSAMCFSCGGELLAAEVKKKAVDPETYINKGLNFARDGKYEDAITCYDEVLKIDRAHERAMVQKGLALHRLGKWGSAVQYVNTVLQANPNNIEALLLKAEILEQRDRLDKSMEIYSQILSIDPQNAKAKSMMEKVSKEADLESAEDVLEQFMCLPGIGLARATTLYDAGYTSLDMLKKASEEQLAGIKGISKSLAKKLKKALESQ